MRIFSSLFLLFLLATTAYAMVSSIENISINGKTVFLVQVGVFSNQHDAEQVQKKLSGMTKEHVTIVHKTETNSYTVQIGPLDNYASALSLSRLQIKEQNDDLPPLIQPKINASMSTPTKQTDSAQNDSSPKIWNLRNADIRTVIDEVARVTGKNFLVDPRVQGKISIVSTTPMTDKALYPVILSMLQVSGYSAVASGHVTKIIPNMDARTPEYDPNNSQKSRLDGDEMMVQVIPIRYVPAEQLIPVLRPLMPQWSTVSAYNPSNMLILSGRANNIKQLAEIIKQVDSSSANGMDLVPLEHALAMDVAKTLHEVLKAQPAGTGQVQPSLAADDRSNAILISGNKTDRLRLRLLIAQLDQKNPNGSNSNTQVIYLNYLRAEDLVPILAGIAQASFSGTVGTTIGSMTTAKLDSTNPTSMGAAADGPNNNGPSQSSSMMGSSAAAPNTNSSNNQNEGSTKPSVQIIAEPNTNSIILNAPATLIRTLKSVINQLDIKPAQLLIEALVAEINESDFNSLGVEWGTVSQTTRSSDSFKPGFAILNSTTSIDQFEAQIYALARAHKANILSTPSVVVLDNRQAKILIGKQVSVASSSYPNNGGGTTTATPYTTYDRVNVALHLYVRPQITRGKGIQMQIDQGNDTLDATDALDHTSNPTFNISAIVTSVHVESGDIIVLGGLAQDKIGNDQNGIPILSDIPGIGRLFQQHNTNREKKVLMVFIRPHILKTERDGMEITGGKYHQMREEQLKLARAQDMYNPADNDTIAPPWHQSKLPKPFSHPLHGTTKAS